MMKIKFTNKGEVPLDKYPLGTVILERKCTHSEFYSAYRVMEDDSGERYLESFDGRTWLYQYGTENFGGWVALEIEE